MLKKRLRVLVTAGPTREYIDPTRFISNPSSGMMGYLIADEARKTGCDVLLISGPTVLKTPSVKTVNIVSATEMFREVKRHFKWCDILVMTAAVADYRPKTFFPNKIKKSRETLNIEFKKNPDILKWAGMHKGKKCLIGFAAETAGMVKNAKKKLKSKNLDFIVANEVGSGKAGFESDNIRFLILDSARTINGAFQTWKKKRLARKIVRLIHRKGSRNP